MLFQIVERGVDPNSRDGDGATPLHFAASRGHLSTVRWLLRHGAKLHLDHHGKSPINDAAENHHLELERNSIDYAFDTLWIDNLPLKMTLAKFPPDARKFAYRPHAKLEMEREGRGTTLSSEFSVGGCITDFPLHCIAPINCITSCLNLLVAAGAESKQLSSYKTVHTCACAPGDSRCALPSCINATMPRSPFYLHSPGQPRKGSLPALADGVYVNPMQRGPSAPGSQPSSGEDSSGCSASDADTGSGGWFLHSHNISNNNSNSNTNKKNYNSNGSAPAALYQRVRDLFQSSRSPGPGARSPAEGQEAPTMTVKAEVHGSTEASTVPEVGSDSDSGADAVRRDHDYEDIYLPRDDHQRQRSSSRDSGSHSRPGSAALVVDYIAKEHETSNKTYEEVTPTTETSTRSSIVSKLAALTHKAQNLASRLSSAAGSRRASVSDEVVVTTAPSGSSGVSSGGSSGDEAPPPPPPPPAPPAPPPPVVLEEPALRPSELKGRLETHETGANNCYKTP
ncbi:Espin [Eumeta japonica]|uniref:Espin n=1 Tax=Eumeta variegata TaxID=151549 RepID=A0A4C1XV39_EUMVA|nr:Espin [Eumeta japonica]